MHSAFRATRMLFFPGVRTVISRRSPTKLGKNHPSNNYFLSKSSLNPLSMLLEKNTDAFRLSISQGDRINVQAIDQLMEVASQNGNVEAMIILAEQYPDYVTAATVSQSINNSPQKSQITHDFLQASAADKVPEQLKTIINSKPASNVTKIFPLEDTTELAAFLNECQLSSTAGDGRFVLRNGEEYDAVMAEFQAFYDGYGNITLAENNQTATKLVNEIPHFLDLLLEGNPLSTPEHISHFRL